MFDIRLPRACFLLSAATVICLSLSSSGDAAVVSKSILKQYFQTGDVPTEDQFVDLIDSLVDLTFTFGSFNNGHSVTARAGGISETGGWAIGHIQDQVIGPALSFAPAAGIGTGSDWPGHSGFLGFQFEIEPPGLGPSTHYGFLQMSVDGPGATTPHAIHITGLAYETTPDTAITTFAVTVAEPSTLALCPLLALLAIPIARRRRRRAAQQAAGRPARTARPTPT